MSLIQTAALLGSLVSSVAAHGYVSGIVAGGTFYEGYSPSFQYASPAPVVIGWSDPEDLSNGFVPPSNYSGPDIICHLGATPGQTHATIAAGDQVEFQWTAWPESHHGPVITYLANCNGECESVDKTTLEFFKIDAVGLVDDTTVPGTWGSDQLIANNNSWVVNIPTTLAAGNYVARHEIIALHSAGTADGAQNYPQCINLKITGSGTAAPAGTLGEKLYSEDDAGILVNIYQSLSTYDIPGPTLWSGAAAEASQTEVAIGSNAAAATAAATTSAASSAAATTSAAASTSAAATSAAATTAAATSANVAAASVASSSAAQQTSTIIAVATTTASAAAATSEAATLSSAAASVYAPISSLTEIIPSSVLTETVAATATASASGIPAPSKALPAGTTLKDLFQWLRFMLSELFAGEFVQKRSHARDLTSVKN
ncbi:hypothetical protein M8818_006190 [Zalaria obscura]|uniref:Uncharacterized protein n=1 Tax=Zalaria obscura TaxID=2024903 RepID=A0ACC3S775_9PEZI